MSEAIVRLSGGDVALFASDTHLGDHDPATAGFFLEALAGASAGATHLFLLGDVFEAWVGDDQPDDAAARAIEALARISARGCRVLAMRGNRDFLLGRGPAASFEARSGATLIGDPSVIDLFGEPVLLMHGDSLCTDDVGYQRFRALAQTEAWQAQVLAKPLAERLAMARAMRAESERSKAALAGEAGYLMDANAAAVDGALRAAGARTMVHGHTHRPACHRWQLDGAPATRWVLPDWDAAARRGGFLRADARGFSRVGDWPAQ